MSDSVKKYNELLADGKIFEDKKNIIFCKSCNKINVKIGRAHV